MTTVDFNDADLVAASLAGNRDAFAQIVSQYQSLVCSLAYSATGSLSQSEDLAQETFLKAWRQLANLKEPQKLRSWLCGIARNTIVDSLRGQHRQATHCAEPLDAADELPASEMPIAESVIQREEEAILWRSINQIPENYREPLILFYREGESVERVAEELELSEDAVKQRLSRGRKLLAEEVTAFVESTLKRSTPGRAFTLGVLAAIPFSAKTATAATASAALLKGATVSSTAQTAVNTFIMTTKTKIILAAVVAVAAVSTPILIQQRNSAKLREENQLLEQRANQIEIQNQRLAAEASEAKASERLSQEQTRELARLRNQAGQVDDVKKKLAEKMAAANKKEGGMEYFFSQIMDDPQAKKFIRDQQRMMVTQLYAAFAKQAGLSPEETEKFYEAMLDRQMQSMEKARPFFNGDSKDRAAASKAMAADQKSFDGQLQELLGETRFAQFKSYEQSAYDRLQLNQFKDQPRQKLTEQQNEQLLTIMKEERQQATTAGFPGINPQSFESMPPADQLEKMIQAQQSVNEKIFSRASDVLSPEQLEAFGKFQTNQLAAGRLAMSMAQKMFGAKK